MAEHAMKYIQGTEPATIKGHLNQIQLGTWSTTMDERPIPEPDNVKTHNVFIAMADMAGKIYID